MNTHILNVHDSTHFYTSLKSLIYLNHFQIKIFNDYDSNKSKKGRQ